MEYDLCPFLLQMSENLWLLKLLLSFLGMIDNTKAHWQASSWKSRVSMEIGQPVRHTVSKQRWCACVWIIKFSRLPHGANVDAVPLLKTMSRWVCAHWWIPTLLVFWRTCVTYSEHRARLFSLKSLSLFGDGCSNIVLSLVSPHQVRCEGR